MWFWIYFLLTSATIFTISFRLIEKRQLAKIVLDDYNTLLQCESCGKFHRKYQEELEIRINKNYKGNFTCPRCYGDAKIYKNPEYAWIKTNPECPKLTIKDVKKLKKVFMRIEKFAYDDESIEKFLYYYHLIPRIENVDNDKKS